MKEEDSTPISIIKTNLGPRRIVILLLIVLAILLSFAQYFFSQPERDDVVDNMIHVINNISTYEKPERKKLLYVFVALGTHPERNEIIRKNVEHIVMKNQNDDKYQVDCLIFGYAAYNDTPTWIHDLEKDANSPCKYIKVFKERYVYFFKHVPDFFLERSGYSYVTFVLDDVVHYPPHGNFDFRDYFDIIFQNDLEIVAPAVVGSYWSGNTGPRPIDEKTHQVGRIVKFLEIQVLTLKPHVWRCFNELLDTEFPSGYGIDLWFYNYCVVEKKVARKESFALIDKYFVHHNPDGFPSTHQGEDPDRQVRNWRDLRGVELIVQNPDDDGILYYFENS